MPTLELKPEDASYSTHPLYNSAFFEASVFGSSSGAEADNDEWQHYLTTSFIASHFCLYIALLQ